MKKKVPAYNGTLRDHTIMCPYCISECSGIRIFGKRIKSIAFSTDVAIDEEIQGDQSLIIQKPGPKRKHNFLFGSGFYFCFIGNCVL